MKAVYQVQLNPRGCGWMEMSTHEDRARAEEALEKAKKRSNGDPDFEHRIIVITLDA